MLKDSSRSLIVLLFVSGCQNWAAGFLLVSGPGSTEYQILQVRGSNEINIESRTVGTYNQRVALEPGLYVVLADCSQREAIIHSNRTTILQTQQVNFIKPPGLDHTPGLFSVHCSQFESIKRRQHFTDKFRFDLLEQRKQLLVGMAPMNLALTRSEPASVDLAAIRVVHHENSNGNYYISPADGRDSLTEKQAVNQWTFLLPGSYTIMVNSSKTKVDIEAGQAISLPLGDIVLTADVVEDTHRSNVGLGLDQNISFDNTTSLLSGRYELFVENNSQTTPLQIDAAAQHQVKLRNFRITLGCMEHEWECRGIQKYTVYSESGNVKLASGQTDQSILLPYQPILVELVNNPGMYLSSGPNQQSEEVGSVLITPRYRAWPGHRTDLIRIEAHGPKLTGYSYDISATGPTTLPLFAGSYKLSNYITGPSGRKTHQQIFRSRVNSLTKIEATFYRPTPSDEVARLPVGATVIPELKAF